MFTACFRRALAPCLCLGISLLSGLTPVRAQELAPPAILQKVTGANERMEMTVNTSRILTLDRKITQAQVNNPDVLEPTPLAPNQVQVFAKNTGVTQVNLWDEDERVFTVDVIVYGDAQELAMVLKSEFPNAALNVKPVSTGVLISGYVDQPSHVQRIVQIAEEYYPRVINNLTVGGVQQVLLHVKVMEVSRTKLRKMGFDFSIIQGDDFFTSSVSGLITSVSGSGSPAVSAASNANVMFGVVDGSSAFFGVLEALRQDNLMKVLSEPTLVTVSGRPALFQVGGEFPILVPQSLGTTSIEYKPYGTQVDFVPIVLGNGKIRLEVRPRVSEIDNARSVTTDGITVPGLRVRQVDTGVEMEAGQTLAIAGLVETRVEAVNSGIPWVSEVPYVGALFRSVQNKNNEIELLVLVTPELVDAMDPSQVAPCGPGMNTSEPSDTELFLGGHLEVPNCCMHCGGAGCQACGGSGSAMGMAPGAPSQPGVQLSSPTPAPPQAGASARRAAGTRMAATPAPRPEGVRELQAVPSRRSTQPPKPKTTAIPATASEPSFIGPIGYDELQ